MAKIAIPRKKTSNETTAASINNETAEIQKLAYQFFVERGFQHGHDKEDWSRAEAIIRRKKA
jgi:NAD/NADP transhydrogenase alpha subunit